MTSSLPFSVRILVVDNYDSFTYNLVQYLEGLGARCDVRLNDELDVRSVGEARPDGLLLSPGPGTPREAGVTSRAIAVLAGELPILGVCLGHQAIGQCFGAQIGPARRLMHGKSSAVQHDGATLFRGLPSPVQVGRYHSLVVEESSVPACFTVSARADDGDVMALRHRRLPIEGVQFHPESILTDDGLRLMTNWLESL